MAGHPLPEGAFHMLPLAVTRWSTLARSSPHMPHEGFLPEGAFLRALQLGLIAGPYLIWCEFAHVAPDTPILSRGSTSQNTSPCGAPRSAPHTAACHTSGCVPANSLGEVRGRSASGDPSHTPSLLFLHHATQEHLRSQYFLCPTNCDRWLEKKLIRDCRRN